MSAGPRRERQLHPPDFTYPNGCHIAEVEIDTATGVTRVVRYTVVDDFGSVINPLLLEGQVHGGTVQGIGQALYEYTVYDSDSGQLITGSLMDYCLPRADDVPFFAFTLQRDPDQGEPARRQGRGRSRRHRCAARRRSTRWSTRCRPYGVRHIDMPATPEKVWRAINGASATQAAE